MKASVIIVNYNGERFLRGCLNSILNQSYNDFELIIVDNNSQDNSLDVINEFADERIIVNRLKRNTGFAEGNNIGYSISSGNYIVLLNNDTIVDMDWLKELIKTADDNKNAAIVQSLIKTEGIPEKYYESNGTINMLGHNIMNVFGINSKGIGQILQAGGASVLIKRDAAEKLGGLFLNEYFAYAEDTFLSLKAKFAGYDILHTNHSRVKHFGGGAAIKNKDMLFFQERNRILNFVLFFSKSFRVKYNFYLLFNLILKAAASMSGRYSISAVLKAYKWIFRNKEFINSKREKLKDVKKIDEGEILKLISCKLIDGNGFIASLVNFLSKTYCRIVNLNVLELQ